MAGGSERVWGGLDPAQREGFACVVCGRGYLPGGGPPRVPVGRSRTGSQVFACVGGVCERTARAAGDVVVPDVVWAVAGVAFLAVVDAAGGEVGRASPDHLVTAVVTAAAPLVVAAELRRLAATAHEACCRCSVVLSWPGAGWWVSQDTIRRRAIVLDPAPGGGEWR